MRPATVEAWQWDGSAEAAELITDWIIDNDGPLAYKHPYENVIVIDGETVTAKPTDWIVRDKFNDFWPLDENLFPGAYAQLVGK